MPTDTKFTGDLTSTCRRWQHRVGLPAGAWDMRNAKGQAQVFVFSQRCPIKTTLCNRTTTFDVALKESSGCDQIRQDVSKTVPRTPEPEAPLQGKEKLLLVKFTFS